MTLYEPLAVAHTELLQKSTKASLFSSLAVMLQITAPMGNLLNGGYSKVCNININYGQNALM